MRTAFVVIPAACLLFLFFCTRALSLPPPEAHTLSLRYLPVPNHLELHPNYRSAIKRAIKEANPPADQDVYGNILPQGIYWTEVLVGTPPQRFLVAVDTGSTDLTFPEAGCVGCHDNITGSYDASASSTSKLVTCGSSDYQCNCGAKQSCVFSASYETCNLTDPTQSCTIDCRVYTDIVKLGSQETRTAFGTIYSQTKNFQQLFYIDGIVGLIPDFSSFGGISAFDALVKANLYTNQFALCLNASNGGKLTFGGYDPAFMLGDSFDYTPLSSTYAVRMTNVQVDGVDVVPRPNQRELILDSGTNTLLLDNLLYLAVQNSIVKKLCPGFDGPGVCSGSPLLFDGGCYEYTEEQIASFPNISVVLSGATLTVDGAGYLVPKTVGSSTRCYALGNTGTLGILILGDVIMQNYYVLFDNVNGRVGWAPVNAEACSAE